MITIIIPFVILIILISSLYVNVQSFKTMRDKSQANYRRYLLYGYILDNLLIILAVFFGLYTTYSYNIFYIITAMVGSITIVISILSDKARFKQKTRQTNEPSLYYDMAKLISITLFIILIVVLTVFKVA